MACRRTAIKLFELHTKYERDSDGVGDINKGKRACDLMATKDRLLQKLHELDVSVGTTILNPY